MRQRTRLPPIAILGTGLIGGSIGLALRRSGFAGEIRGFDRPEVLVQARRRRAIDVAAADVASACRGAGGVILALPVGAILDLLPQAAASASPRAWITDTGSTKRRICALAAGVAGARFLGGHPMAGRERGGIASARADLFAGSAWLLVSEPATRAAARRRARLLVSLLERIGARPLWTDAATHDAALARLSHLPQLLSTALACQLAGNPLVAAAGPGVRAMLRLAASPYSLWRDILLTNSDEIGAALDSLRRTLEEMRAGLRSREIERCFEAGRALALALAPPGRVARRPGGDER